MWTRCCLLAAVLAALGLAAPAASQAEKLDTEQIAAKLQRSVATVRVWLPSDDAAEAGADDQTQREAADDRADKSDMSDTKVFVCSGVSLGGGLFVAPAFAGTDARIYITLPGGDQAKAKLRVIDEYSGLALLETSRSKIDGLPLADGSPNVGASVLSAAGWGAEQPVVSMGIVSGHERTPSGSRYPPLLQADIRTTETSSGAALVSGEGELVGVIVLVEGPDQRRGWTFAVPASHVQRLLRAHGRQQPEGKSVVVLSRRRPVVGWMLGGNADDVRVKKLTPGGPAEEAGVEVGDRVLAADGVQIRSVYQALRPVLFKQPGDTMTFLVERDDGCSEVRVVLGGGVKLPSAPVEMLSRYIQPKVEIDGLDVRRLASRGGERPDPRAFSQPPPEDDEAAGATTQQQIELLQRALKGYRQGIVYLQGQLDRRERERRATEAEIERLREEVESLKALIAEISDGERP